LDIRINDQESWHRCPAKLTIPADVARSYREAGIKLFLFTSRNESDSAMMIALQPYGSRDQRRGPLPALA